MRTERTTAAIVALAMLCLAPFAWGQSDAPDPSVRLAVPVDGAPTLGPSNAVVTIVEFSDFYCPYCRRANATLSTLLRIYPEQLRVVYRHSLLDADTGSQAAEAALAADAQGAFWPFHDRMFAGPAPHTVDGLVAVASEVGLDVESFRSSLVLHSHREELMRDVALAKKLGLRGVPQFFINGRALSGAHPLSVFVRVIDEEIAIAGQLLGSAAPPSDIYQRMLAHRSDSLSGADEIFARKLEAEQRSLVGLGRESHRRGSENALVTLVEFSDYTCGYCRRNHPVLAQLGKLYGADLRFVYRHFPLGSLMKPVAEAAEEAAVQGKFWEFTDRIFADEQVGHQTRVALLVHAKAAGLDLGRFTRALNEHSHAPKVAADAAAAAALGVSGTPTMFINGRHVIGAAPLATLRAIVDEEIIAARALREKGASASEIYRKRSTQAD